MAKRRSANRRRDANSSSLTGRLSTDSPRVTPADRSLPSNLDNRSYHPAGLHRPAPRRSGVASTIATRPAQRPKQAAVKRLTVIRGPGGKPLKSKRKVSLSSVRQFLHPASVLVCLRRSVRKEVLLALGKKRGRGAGRKSWHSNIRC